MNQLDFKGKTAVVTGGAQGIGAAIVKRLEASGAKVAIWDLDGPGKVDVADPASILGALQSTLEQLDKIDILVNNAGIGGGGDNQVFGRIKYPVFDDVMHTNVVGPLKIAEAFVEHVAASAKKMLMMVSSSQGSIASARGASLYFYRSSKTALNMITINLAKTLKERGIIVGLVAPGATDTDFMAEVRGRMPLGDPKERTADMIAEIDKFTMEKSGAFVEWNGQTIPW